MINTNVKEAIQMEIDNILTPSDIKPPVLREAKIHADSEKFGVWLAIHGFDGGTYVCVGRLPISSKIGDQYLFINRHGMIVKIPYEEGRFEFLDPLP